MPKKSPKKPQLQPHRIMHIFCEGEKTEPYYIQGYIDTKFNQKRIKTVPTKKKTPQLVAETMSLQKRIKIVPTTKNTPVQLVAEAMSLKSSGKCLENDEFWVVYDRESEAKYSDELHQKALDRALHHGINVALSNVCFERWILLHLSDSTAPYSCYNDLKNNSDLIELLSARGIKNYDKGDQQVFDAISEHVGKARSRAKQINQTTLENAILGRVKPYQLNPYTDVYKLLDAIDVFK